jgi:phosphatidylinositol alpha-mannosyltransferase
MQDGHNVKIVAPCLKNGTRYFDESIYAVGRPVPIPFAGSIARVPISPWLPIQMGKVLREEKFDILHLHEPFTPMVCLSALLQSSCVNIGTFHACHERGLTVRFLQPILKKLANRLDGRIAVSEAALNFVSKFVPGDYRIIPNGINTHHFCPEGPRREELLDGKFNILFVGRLEKRKGLGRLLQAAAIVKKEFSKFRIIVVGPGTLLRPGYQAIAKNLGLEVVFTDYVMNESLPDYYRTADIYCSPATGAESFGIVLLEAMACGKPVVATNLEGYATVLDQGQEGLLTPVGDDQALARALLTLIYDRALREQMSAKGIMKAEKYSWENVSQQVMDYYRSLLKEPSLK